MRAGVGGFEAGRLLQARLCRGLTQSALGVMVGRSSASVSKWERGDQLPDPEVLPKLSESLGVPMAWFLRPQPEYGDRPYFYRSNAAITREAREIARVRLEWLNDISCTVQHWVDWPSVRLPSLDADDHRKIEDGDIERITLDLRREFKLGLGPISDVLLVLENAGVVCVREELGYAKMDGVSKWFQSDNRPYMLIAADKANGVRSRFDAAHELAHLVLHRSLSNLEFNKRYAEIERQAHLFAGSFLLPAESFAAEVSHPSLDTFLTLKPRWKVSIAAMIMRCVQLGIVTDEYAVRLWKSYGARGWRKGEPFDDTMPLEQVRLMPRAVKMLIADGGISKASLMDAIGLNAGDCERLCSLPEGFFQHPHASVTELRPIRLKQSESATGARADIYSFPGKQGTPSRK